MRFKGHTLIATLMLTASLAGFANEQSLVADEEEQSHYELGIRAFSYGHVAAPPKGLKQKDVESWVKNEGARSGFGVGLTFEYHILDWLTMETDFVYHRIASLNEAKADDHWHFISMPKLLNFKLPNSHFVPYAGIGWETIMMISGKEVESFWKRFGMNLLVQAGLNYFFTDWGIGLNVRGGYGLRHNPSKEQWKLELQVGATYKL